MSFYKNLVNFIAPVAKAYHRIEIEGIENVPPSGEGFIVVANHSGWFGWDAIVIGALLSEHIVHWLAWSYEKEHPSWDLSVKALDGILCNKEKPFPYGDAVDMLKRGESVGIFPEGNSNPMTKWYRLRPFLPGFARLAAMSGATVLPCAVAGLEEASPILWAKEEIGEPIKTSIALPVVFPTKVHMCFGAPMRFGADPGDRDALLAAAAETQREILSLLKRYRPKAYAESADGRTIT